MSYPKLTAKEWEQIPPEYIYFAVDYDGEQWAYAHKLKKVSGGNSWLRKGGEALKICDTVYRPVHDWANSLQQRPELTQPEIKEIGAAALNQILAKEGFNPAPRTPVVNVSYRDFMQIAGKLSLSINQQQIGGKETVSAYLCNPASEYVCLFAADVPTATEFDDDGIELLVRAYEKIKI